MKVIVWSWIMRVAQGLVLCFLMALVNMIQINIYGIFLCRTGMDRTENTARLFLWCLFCLSLWKAYLGVTVLVTHRNRPDAPTNFCLSRWLIYAGWVTFDVQFGSQNKSEHHWRSLGYSYRYFHERDWYCETSSDMNVNNKPTGVTKSHLEASFVWSSIVTLIFICLHM